MNNIQIRNLSNSENSNLTNEECSLIVGGGFLDDIGKGIGIASGIVSLGKSLGIGGGESKEPRTLEEITEEIKEDGIVSFVLG